MKQIALLAAVAVLLAARPAEACRGSAPCPWPITAAAYALGFGIIGGYAVGTGAFVYRDLTDETQDLEYGALELGFNGSMGFLFAGATIDAAKNKNAGSAVVLGGFAALHTTLAVHGGWRIYRERSDLEVPEVPMTWIAGSLYGVNTLIWTSQLDERHGRTYGLVEAGVNVPLAAGLGYLAYDRFAHGNGGPGPGLLYGGLAVVSGAFVVHGLRTAIDPPKANKLDLLGTDVMPTMVSDGIELAPGLGAAGTW
jgi:hypothetical protein